MATAFHRSSQSASLFPPGASTARAFFFGGLDPSGSITLDKLPGAFWPDAVSVWLFGPHTWAAALPHVIEGVLTVWLLHRIVRARPVRSPR